VVPPGTTLTIEPGVVVRVAADVQLWIRGRLVARGSADAPILFTAADGPAWKRIYLDGGVGPPALVIEHATVERAATALELRIAAGSVQVRDSTLRANEVGIAGRASNLDAASEIVGNTIAENKAAGIDLRLGAGAAVPLR